MTTKGFVCENGWVIVPLKDGGNITKNRVTEFTRGSFSFQFCIKNFTFIGIIDVEIPKEWQDEVFSEKALMIRGYL